MQQSLRDQRLPSMVHAFLDTAPRFVFLTGKGDVGKTSIACAAALTLVKAGTRSCW